MKVNMSHVKNIESILNTGCRKITSFKMVIICKSLQQVGFLMSQTRKGNGQQRHVSHWLTSYSVKICMWTEVIIVTKIVQQEEINQFSLMVLWTNLNKSNPHIRYNKLNHREQLCNYVIIL